MPVKFTEAFCLLFLVIFFHLSVGANVELPSVFSDNMVLQQKANAAIWGTATPAQTVTITTSWDKRTYRVKSDNNGSWKVKVATPKFGGPYNIDISEGKTIHLKNVLIGDVWLCSGQSNMEMPLAGWGRINNYEREIANANYPNIRLLQAIHVTSNQPIANLQVRNKGWDICTPETVTEFSSVAYFFAREIFKKTGVPIGLIHSSWGGTIAEAWTSYESLSNLTDFAAAAKAIKSTPDKNSGNVTDQLATWNKLVTDKDAGLKNGEPVWLNTGDEASWKEMKLPGVWENGELGNMDGVVWFKKKISIPTAWKGEDLVLVFMADDEDITWFNGTKIGETKGYNTERRYKIPASLVKEGNNEILIRVFDTGGGGGVYNDAFRLENSKGERFALNGSWPYAVGVNLKDLPPNPATQEGPNRPTVLYNAMINPIIDYNIKGAIWYQGESNAGRAYQYRTLFPAMIKDWRSKFKSGDFPFYFVQLANFMKRADNPGPSNWAELREAQLMTTSLKNTGMATIIDIGDAVDIHPKNKQEVGRRLALIALNKLYNKGNEFSGPMYRSFAKSGNKITLNFTHAAGLKTSDRNKVKGFSIAGPDKKFYWADAKISGNQVIISTPDVKNPIAVRYGWADNPDVNLVNSANLPASPFRTDTWPETTLNNK